MSKILEQNGIENTSLDAARFNRFCAGNKDGIVKGSFSECRMTLISSNVIEIAKGEMLISGFRVILSETTYTFSSFPSSPTRYQIVAQIQLNSEKQPELSVFYQVVSVLRQEDLFDENASSPIYQIEIGRFSLEDEAVTDLVQTLDVLTGGSGKNNSLGFKLGSVETEAIDIDMDAEVDIDEQIDETGSNVLNFKFCLPTGALNTVKSNTETALSKSQTAIASGNEAKIIAQQAKDYVVEQTWKNLTVIDGGGLAKSASLFPKLNFEYDTDNFTATVGATNKSISGDIIIPDYVMDENGQAYSVVGIRESGFEDSSISSIVMPNTLTSIGQYAFMACTKLIDITFGNKVKTIGNGAFRNCTLLSSIALPESLESLGDYAFAYCFRLANPIVIPTNVISIGGFSFMYCSELTKVYIPANVTTIAAFSPTSAPFSYCSSNLQIYTNLESQNNRPSGWDNYWNYYKSGATLTVNYGCTIDEFLSNIGG